MSTAHAVKCVLHTRSWSSLLPAPPRLYSHTLKFSGTLISTGCFSETREPWSWGPKKHVIQKTRVDEGFYARTQNTQHTYTQVHTHTYTEVHTHAHTVDWSSQPIPFPQFTALGKSDFLNFHENENVLRCLFCFEVFKNNSAWKIVFSCSHFFFPSGGDMSPRKLGQRCGRTLGHNRACPLGARPCQNRRQRKTKP